MPRRRSSTNCLRDCLSGRAHLLFKLGVVVTGLNAAALVGKDQLANPRLNIQLAQSGRDDFANIVQPPVFDHITGCGQISA